MDAIRSTPQGAHYHTDVIYFNWEKERRQKPMVVQEKSTPDRVPTNNLYTPVNGTLQVSHFNQGDHQTLLRPMSNGAKR